jgi:hypothetical protein
MTVSLTIPDMPCNQPLDAATHDVMCLVKRHTYELAFAVPLPPYTLAGGAQPRVHVCVKQPCQTGGLVLNLEDVECLYEDLLQLMAYIQNERQALVRADPAVHPGPADGPPAHG